jgi:hypothetical protein
MKKLTKPKMNQEELLFGVHKTFSAIYFLEKNQIDEVKHSLTVALQIFEKFLKIDKNINQISIAYEITRKTSIIEGNNWFAHNEDNIIILRQLLPLKEYTLLIADALKALLIWKDQKYAKKQLKSALNTLNYEIISISL